MLNDQKPELHMETDNGTKSAGGFGRLQPIHYKHTFNYSIFYVFTDARMLYNTLENGVVQWSMAKPFIGSHQ